MLKKVKQSLAVEKVFFHESLSRIFSFLAFLFFLFALAGFAVSVQNPELAGRAFDSLRQSYESKGFFNASSNFDLFILIFLNNIAAAFFSLAAGVIPFFFLSALAVIANGFFLGVIGAVVLAQGKGVSTVILSLLPHGIVELPAFFYASSLGIYLMQNISRKIIGRPVKLRAVFKNSLRSFIVIVLPLLLLAAFLEAYVTYAIVSK